MRISTLIKGVGTLLLLACLGWWVWAGVFIWQGQKTTGAVKDLVDVAMGTSGFSWSTVGLQRPVVQYSVGKSSYTFEAYPTGAGHYQVSDPVDLYYDAQDVGRAWTQSDLLYGWPVIIFIFAELIYFVGKILGSGSGLG